jgi:hypothetical protein
MEIINRINNLSKDYWVSSDKIIFRGNNIRIDFILKINNDIERYKIICENIIEYLICDVNGGGINLWKDNNHYMLRQFTDETYSLKIMSNKNIFDNMIYKLYKLHTRKYNDWIPFDKYFKMFIKTHSSKYSEIYNGPKFIVMEYIKVLNKNNVKYLMESIGGKKFNGNIKMIHFGNSYIVAENIYDKKIDEKI